MPQRAKDILRLVQVSSEVEIKDCKEGGRERDRDSEIYVFFSFDSEC